MNSKIATKDKMFFIRKGNELFNNGEVEVAKKYFMKANYHDGMLRVADHYFYKKRLPLNALPLYMKCGAKTKVDEIFERMAFALGRMIGDDKKSKEKIKDDVS
jgi:hypothetical protein